MAYRDVKTDEPMLLA